MKVGFFTEPNSKGQIVIPKKIRDELNINENTPLNMVVRGEGIWLYPIKEVLTQQDSEDSRKVYLEILKRTKGILAGKPYYKNEKARRKLELEASKRRKEPWW